MISGLSSSPASALEVVDEASTEPSSLELLTQETVAAAITLPGASCVGVDACFQGPTTTGTNSCVGEESCFQGPSEVGDNTCIGYRNCFQGSGFSGTVFGSDSCNGFEPCFQNSGDIGDNSCNGYESCFQQSMDIGNYSCNGETACLQQAAMDADPEAFGMCPFDFPCGTVGNNSCNGVDACLQNFSNVGNNSCNGDDVCVHQSETVGDCEFNSVSVTGCVGAAVPVVTISTPADDVDIDASLVASFACADTGGYKLAICTATLNGDAIANGAAINTATSGAKVLAVTGTDSSGNTLTSSLKVTVIADEVVPVPPVVKIPVVNPRIITGEFAKGSGVDGSVSRLYIAVFGRQPDGGGHLYWVVQQQNGATLWDIAREFVASQEFVDTYADLDNKSFVELLYTNVMGRDGDAEGIAYWTNLLDTNTLDRGGVTLMFGESPELKTVTQTS